MSLGQNIPLSSNYQNALFQTYGTELNRDISDLGESLHEFSCYKSNLEEDKLSSNAGQAAFTLPKIQP